MESKNHVEQLFVARAQDSIKTCETSDLDPKLLLPLAGMSLPLLFNYVTDNWVTIPYLAPFLTNATADTLFYFSLGMPVVFLSGINFAVGINCADQVKDFKEIPMSGNFTFLASGLATSALLMAPSKYLLGSIDYFAFIGGAGFLQAVLGLWFMQNRMLPKSYWKL